MKLRSLDRLSDPEAKAKIKAIYFRLLGQHFTLSIPGKPPVQAKYIPATLRLSKGRNSKQPRPGESNLKAP